MVGLLLTLTLSQADAGVVLGETRLPITVEVMEQGQVVPDAGVWLPTESAIELARRKRACETALQELSLRPEPPVWLPWLALAVGVVGGGVLGYQLGRPRAPRPTSAP